MKLMLFTGSWCQPCKQMKGIVKEVADSHGIELAIYDVEKDVDIANAYMIRGVPTLLIIGADGEIVDRVSSLVSKEWVIERIKED